MAKEVIIKRICDICKKEEKTKRYPILVKWLTDQTEGKPSNPYYQVEHLDLCDKCLEEVVTIEGVGAQGCNNFRTKKRG